MIREMKFKHYSVERLKKEIRQITNKYLDLKDYKIFFFGSRVAGRGNERSDIDVGIEGNEPIPANIMFKIKDDIENLKTLYKIEFVDFKSVAPDFQKVALQYIEEIL